MNILSIDGGGIRGIYAAHLLKQIQDEIGIQYTDHFDLIAGTSTGSILAAALATKYPLEKVVALYEQHGKEIFSRRPASWLGVLRAKYSSSSLKKQLERVFEEKTLSDTDTNLLIPATDIGNAGVHVFKSPYDPEFVRDRDIRIADAVLASCSAPLYFSPHRVDKYLLADGGMWANNPSLACLVEAQKRFNIEISQVRLLSIGCGIGHRYYKQKNRDSRAWGLVSGWGGPKLVDTILNLQSQTTANMVELLLEPEQYLRLNFEHAEKLTLDDVGVIPELLSKADHDFAHNAAKVRKFLQQEYANKEGAV
ncbi:CBASS cGAMP-activated phospholipase [Thiohalophilus sp.]|uniref:CBASS cGAMP-activated phospholipase n=1 Tax=Thiohalophilus sp. TaxID=3028392 RepID=UPI002ACEC25B|nr:CBASS cGAMP-activated phospholipase [Thiohalophilus sp.]MDZ7662526.1 CBASS cGAMP-activated phospholipase [Thiohalophilus sp.]